MTLLRIIFIIYYIYANSFIGSFRKIKFYQTVLIKLCFSIFNIPLTDFKKCTRHSRKYRIFGRIKYKSFGFIFLVKNRKKN